MDPARLLDDLDANQRAAVTGTTHPLAILAGAGSGKTRVLTRRIAYRCLSGDADPRHVLAVTFTRKAAGELDNRLRSFGLRDLPAAGTFHGLAYAQLRTAWAADGTTPPTLLDRKGKILGRILGNTRRVTPGDLAAEIEWARARMVLPGNYADAVHRHGRVTPVDPERIAHWYQRYEDDKGKRGVIDFDDLLLRCAERIERDPTVAAAQHWRFRHLFVDEFQDVNPLQDRLLRAWLGTRTDLCVVGDPNQAIYGWNGADARFLTSFAEHHTGAEVIRLRDSYRSTPQILAVAASVLDRGTGQTPPLRAHRQDGPLPTVVGYRSDTDEANGIARAIRDGHQPRRPWSAQAVLVRTNAQTTVLELAFRRAGIPYRVRGASRLLDDPHVRDLLFTLTRLNEPLTTTIADLEASIVRQRTELSEAAEVELTPEALETDAGRKLTAYEQVTRLAEELLTLDPTARADGLGGWLRTVLLDDRPDGADAVTIASFHSAKGLEWPIVHLAGLEAGYLPISHAKTPLARAEEERLFYVAVTRATDVLRCSWAQTRTFGTDPVERAPSPYLTWIRQSVESLARVEVVEPDPAERLERSRAVLAAPGPGSSYSAGSGSGPGGRTLAEQDAVRSALRSWRVELARQAVVRPTVVLPDKALEAIARHCPTSPDELAALAGVGPLLRQRHGARLLAIVAEQTTGPAFDGPAFDEPTASASS